MTAKGEKELSRPSHTLNVPDCEDREVGETAVAEEALDGVEGNDSDHTGTQYSEKGAEEQPRVGWEGEEDPKNPKNFSFRRRWFITSVVSFYGIVSPLTSSMIIPCLPAMGATLGVSKSFELNSMVSVYLLGYVVGPFLLGPLSEVYGRRPLLIASNIVFVGFNIGCAEAQTYSQMVAFRFLSGLGGAGPLTVGGGVLSDLWRAEERGKAAALYSLGPLLGPCLGPIAGGLIAENISWRWTFRIVTIVGAVAAIVGACLLPETYAPVLIQRKVLQLRIDTGNHDLRSKFDEQKTIRQRLSQALVRPAILLTTQPIVMAITFFVSFIYGCFCIFLVTVTRAYEQTYNQSVAIASLHYLAVGLGFLVGRQGGAVIMDRLYRRFKAQNGGVGQPEMRLINLLGSIVLVPIGMLLYGWTLQYRVFWFVPDMSLFFFGTGVITITFITNSYLLDIYTLYAASALAAANSVRAIFGFAFPLFATDMYDALGYGWSCSLLALIFLLFGGTGMLLLYKYGPALRARSPYAAGGND